MQQPDPIDDEIVRLKQLAIRHGTRALWIMAGSFVLGIAVGVGTWFLQKPIDRDNDHFGLACGLSLATFLFALVLDRIVFPRPKFRCPSCGYDWEIGDDGGHEWLTWRNCPGCGREMGDHIGYQDRAKVSYASEISDSDR